MRIAYLSGAYIPSRGADSVHAMRMCQAMASLGHEVVLHARAGELEFNSDHAFYGVASNFEIVKHPRPAVRAVGALVNAAMVYQALRASSRADLVYAREVWGLRFAATLGVPFIYESHWAPKSAVYRSTEAGLLRRDNFRKAVFISEALRTLYLRLFPWLGTRRTQVAHDAADPVAWPRTEMPSPASGGPLRVGYVGSFYRGYGVHLVEELARRLAYIEFHIIGGAPEQVEQLRRRTHGLENLLVHGFVPPSTLPQHYAQLDVLVAPYQADTPHIRWISPMKLFEYMAHGKAIVCSDFPVFREVLDDRVHALLVPADHTDAWVAALRALQHSPEVRQRLGSNARERLERHYTWRHRAQRVLAREE